MGAKEDTKHSVHEEKSAAVILHRITAFLAAFAFFRLHSAAVDAAVALLLHADADGADQMSTREELMPLEAPHSYF